MTARTNRGNVGTPASQDLGLVDALAQLSFAVHEIIGSIGQRNDLSITQLRMLGILRDRQPGILELAAKLKLEKSSVTGLVDRAQRRGLVARAAASHDGRAVNVRLTSKGAAIAAAMTRDVEAELARLTQNLSPRDRSHLSRLASHLVAQHTAENRSGANTNQTTS